MYLFNQHIASFSKLLSNVQVHTISTDAYAHQYLKDLLLHKTHYLHLYAMVLDKAFADNTSQSSTSSLLDFGCGNGLLALFAKYCGVQQVVASDVSASFLLAAQQLSKQLNIDLDGWIVGDENTVAKYFTNKKIDIVVGTDVIEHVYNLSSLFTVLQNLNTNLVTVFTTASIAENPFKSASLKALQKKDELVESNAFHTTYNEEFAGMSFLAIRKKIIETHLPSLPQNIISELAICTRGLQKLDIEKAVDNYVKTNQLPISMQHATNTCDPITGSFTERLLTIKEYQQLYLQHNFILSIYYGFYNQFEGGIKSKVAKFLNGIIKLSRNQAKLISPFMVLVGRKSK